MERRSKHGPPSPADGGKLNHALDSWRLWAVVGVAALILALAFRFKDSGIPDESQEPSTDEPTMQAATPSPTADLSEPQAVSESAIELPLQADMQPADHAEAGALSEVPPVEPVEPVELMLDPGQLIASLARLDLSEGKITREQAKHWKQQLAALVDHGAAAVPAIRDFLAQNQELSFDATSGGEFLAQPSLRAAFFDALQQIGGPEAEALMLQTLQTTTLPSEIALLAHHVDQQAPGQYRQEILNAAQETLSMSEKGQLSDWDVGPLFQLLQQYGDASTVATLEQFRSRWNYYTTLSLAGMHNGEGIPVLIREAQNAQGDRGTKRDLVFQMLAQAATQSSDAAAALIEQARRNQISDSAWRKIASGLAGDQYGIGLPPGLNPATKTLPGLKTYHLASGNQNFHSVPLPAAILADELQQRRAFIEQLLTVGASPAAIQALAAAQACLSTETAKR